MSHAACRHLDKALDIGSISVVAILAGQLCHMHIATHQYGCLNAVLEHGIEQSLLG
jgi:hypothetical protein